MSLLCPRPSLSSSRISHCLSASSRSLCPFLLHSSASANASLVFFDPLVSALRYRSFVLSFLSFFCAHGLRARAASFHVVVGVCRVAAAQFVLFVAAHEACVVVSPSADSCGRTAEYENQTASPLPHRRGSRGRASRWWLMWPPSLIDKSDVNESSVCRISHSPPCWPASRRVIDGFVWLNKEALITYIITQAGRFPCIAFICYFLCVMLSLFDFV